MQPGHFFAPFAELFKSFHFDLSRLNFHFHNAVWLSDKWQPAKNINWKYIIQLCEGYKWPLDFVQEK
jgi:hypothetical protein